MKHSLIATLCVAALAACGGKVMPSSSDGPPSSPLPGDVQPPGGEEQRGDAKSPIPGATAHDEAITQGQFQADYYNGARLVHTETVDRPTINYAWSDLHNIRSEDFRAVWTGTIDVAQPGQAIDFNSDIGWSTARLFVDGAEVPFAKRITRVLDAGSHKVRVDFANDWHTTSFNMSFTTHARLDAQTAGARITPTLTSDTKIVHVEIYEADNRYNDVVVSLRDATQPVFLVLSSYHAVRWILDNPAGAIVRGVAYGAHAAGTTVASKTAVPTFEVEGLGYGSAPISAITGRGPDLVKKTYASAGETIDGP